MSATELERAVTEVLIEPEALQQLEIAAAAGIESVAADLVGRSIG